MDEVKDYDLIRTGEFEYTLVLSKDYINQETSGEAVDKVVERQTEQQTSFEDEMDRLYFEYESLWLKSPNVLDKEDAYPRSYYWRLGSRYDPGKKSVLEEALQMGKKIADTEAYLKYVDKVKKAKFTPDSWD